MFIRDKVLDVGKTYTEGHYTELLKNWKIDKEPA